MSIRAGIFTTTLEQVVEQGVQNTRHFKLTFNPADHFDFEAGQFINILFDHEGKVLKRPYSIASPPIWKGYLDLSIRLVEGGIGTHLLWNYKVGDQLKIQGPLGRFVPKTPLPKTIAFVSTGTGIAPFRAMIHDLLEKKASCQIWNIFGNRYEGGDVLYQEEFEELAKKYPQFKNAFIVSRPKTWKGAVGYVQTLLSKCLTGPADTHIYICGLTPMIEEVRKTALEMGFTKEQIFFEKYD
ncbi:MAG: hypothetical protein EXS63_09775 [Candidatus Omnitrophica bacterium]|nr:hypothetical protein [Candidatus Omnitrophota bacterium]